MVWTLHNAAACSWNRTPNDRLLYSNRPFPALIRVGRVQYDDTKPHEFQLHVRKYLLCDRILQMSAPSWNDWIPYSSDFRNRHVAVLCKNIYKKVTLPFTEVVLILQVYDKKPKEHITKNDKHKLLALKRLIWLNIFEKTVDNAAFTHMWWKICNNIFKILSYNFLFFSFL